MNHTSYTSRVLKIITLNWPKTRRKSHEKIQGWRSWRPQFEEAKYGVSIVNVHQHVAIIFENSLLICFIAWGYESLRNCSKQSEYGDWSTVQREIEFNILAQNFWKLWTPVWKLHIFRASKQSNLRISKWISNSESDLEMIRQGNNCVYHNFRFRPLKKVEIIVLKGMVNILVNIIGKYSSKKRG